MNGKKSSLPVELASLIAPGRVYSGKKVTAESNYKKIAVSIQKEISVDKSNDQLRYVYQTDEGMISLDAFELARTLFFHNRHLVNAAYTANGLAGLAYVNREVSPPTIIFPDSTRYPVSYLNTKRARAHLTWLLLEPDARQSMFGIYHSLISNSSKVAFEFEPPNLVGWRLQLSILQKTRYDVLSAARIENVLDARTSVNVVGVKIYHPKSKTPLESDNETKRRRSVTLDVDIDPDLDLGEMPGFGKRLHIQRTQGFSFNVTGIYDTTLVDNKETKKSTPVFVERDSTEQDKAGVGAPSKEGKAQEFDPVINQDSDTIVESEQKPHKFLMFEQVVKELGQSNGITLRAVKCGLFPNPQNNSRVVFQTKDDHKLRFFVATLEVNSANIVMLEADTTSLLKSKGASTLILGLKDDADLNFREIIQNFSDSSAQWRHQYIRERVNYFVSCNHPRLKSKGRLLSEDEYKEKWLASIKVKLKGLYVDPFGKQHRLTNTKG